MAISTYLSATTSNRLAIGLTLAPTNLDLRTTSGTALEQLLIGNVYEALLTRNSDNSVSPGVAQSWRSVLTVSNILSTFIRI